VIASNKQRQEQKNLATLYREKTQGSLWALQEPPIYKYLEPYCKPWQRMDIVVNEDYYHMTTMDENVNYI
jgi:hypothetical protein